jgi:hypothetical protein
VGPTPTHTGPAPTATPPAGETLSFAAAADAYVDAARPTTNLGQVTILRTYVTPEQRSYLRFVVSGVAGRPVTRAVLRVYANGSSTAGFDVRAVSDAGWDENTVTYNNMPAVGDLIASSGSHGGGTVVEVDVTGYITGDGTYSLAMTTGSTKAVSYPSDEAGANRPELIVEIAGGSGAARRPPALAALLAGLAPVGLAAAAAVRRR